MTQNRSFDSIATPPSTSRADAITTSLGSGSGIVNCIPARLFLSEMVPENPGCTLKGKVYPSLHAPHQISLLQETYLPVDYARRCSKGTFAPRRRFKAIQS